MLSQSSLIPGYTHVDKFQDDAEYEELDGEIIEEVEYVTLDLGVIEPTLVPSTSAYRLIVRRFISQVYMFHCSKH